MFNQVAELNIIASNGPQLITGLNKSELIIDLNASNTFVNGDLIESFLSSGKVFRCRWIQGGLKGALTPLEYGTSRILLDLPNPLIDFDLELLPNRYQFTYQVKIYTQTLNPRYAALTEKLGIPLEVLEKIPEQTLSILEGVNTMAGSDTRKLQSDLQSIAQAAQAANSAATAAATKATAAQAKVNTVEGELISAKAEMVQSREFELTQASFVLGQNEFGPCYIATVTHDLMGPSVSMALLDADGDAQGYSQLIANKPGMLDKAMVELSTAQYAENSFPLNLVLHGQASTGSLPETSMTGYAVPNSNYKARLNRTTQRIERQLNGSSTWEIIRDDQSVQSAKLGTDGRIDCLLVDGVTYVFTDVMGSGWQGSNQAFHDFMTVANGAIVL